MHHFEALGMWNMQIMPHYREEKSCFLKAGGGNLLHGYLDIETRQKKIYNLLSLPMCQVLPLQIVC